METFAARVYGKSTSMLKVSVDAETKEEALEKIKDFDWDDCVDEDHDLIIIDEIDMY